MTTVAVMTCGLAVPAERCVDPATLQEGRGVTVAVILVLLAVAIVLGTVAIVQIARQGRQRKTAEAGTHGSQAPHDWAKVPFETMRAETRSSIWRRTQGLLWRGLACLVALCGLGYFTKAYIPPVAWLGLGIFFLAGLETILTLRKLCLRPRDLRYWLGLLGLASFFVFVCCTFKRHETVDYVGFPPGLTLNQLQESR
jgi:hypothetical protein